LGCLLTQEISLFSEAAFKDSKIQISNVSGMHPKVYSGRGKKKQLNLIDIVSEFFPG
jgi:stress-induced morphogen